MILFTSQSEMHFGTKGALQWHSGLGLGAGFNDKCIDPMFVVLHSTGHSSGLSWGSGAGWSEQKDHVLARLGHGSAWFVQGNDSWDVQ